MSVPLLLSFDIAADSLRNQLEGLSYAMSERGVLPESRVVRWVLRQAGF